MFSWYGNIKSVDDVFEVALQFSPKFPTEPPNVTIVSPSFHPNIDKHGKIVGFFSSQVTPEDPTLRAAVAKALAAS